MIHNVKGDAVKLLQASKVDGLMHCCNARGVMGAGIAAQIKQAYPSTYTAYRNMCAIYSDMPEESLGIYVEQQGVYNIIGQLNVGTHKRQVDYGALAIAFTNINLAIHKKAKHAIEPYKLALPKYMGCGLAGGDWDTVRELLVLFTSPVIDLYIVDFQK